MIFESLANFVMKHAKVILIVWILVLLASAYPAMHASEKLSYSTSSMGSSTNESIDGLIIMGDHFQSQVDSESMQMILVVYDSATEDQITALNNNMVAIADSDELVSAVIPGGAYTGEDGKHMLMYAVSYKTDV